MLKKFIPGLLLCISLLSLNAQTFFELKVSNDMTYFTDRYFSNGIALNITGPSMQNSPFTALLLPHKTTDRVYYSFTFVHNIYTPSETYTTEINPEDHPYAAYVLFGTRKESFSRFRQTKTTSEFAMGWMGPLAGGGLFQNAMHSVISIAEYVQGWDYQISNDICLQYSARLDKSLFRNRWLECNGYLGGKLGSPHSEGQVGTYFRAGWFDPYFSHNGFSESRRLQVYGFCSGDMDFICYNAVLQGGLNNVENEHTLEEINKSVYHLVFGGTLIYNNIKIELAQEVISPQFRGMYWHRWAYLSLMIGI